MVTDGNIIKEADFCQGVFKEFCQTYSDHMRKSFAECIKN